MPIHTSYLRADAFHGSLGGHSSSIKISVGPGSPIITDAVGIFKEMDPRFKKWGLTGRESLAKTVSISKFRIIKDFRMRELLESVHSDFDSFAFTKAQVVAIALNSKSDLPVAPFTTYVPFKEVRGTGAAAGCLNEYFVARIFRRANHDIEIYVYNMEDDDEWSSELIPQIILPSSVYSISRRRKLDNGPPAKHVWRSGKETGHKNAA